MMNNLVFLVAVYFMYSGSILMYRSTRRAGFVVTSALGSSELLRLMGGSPPSLHCKKPYVV